MSLRCSVSRSFQVLSRPKLLCSTTTSEFILGIRHHKICLALVLPKDYQNILALFYLGLGFGLGFEKSMLTFFLSISQEPTPS